MKHVPCYDVKRIPFGFKFKIINLDKIKKNFPHNIEHGFVVGIDPAKSGEDYSSIYFSIR